MAPKKTNKEAEKDAHEKREKKSKEGAPSMNDRLNSLLMDVSKGMKGRAVLMPASDYVLPWYTRRLPTGLLTLDLELKGGWPTAGISQVIGRRNAGKSKLVWMTIRQLQYLLGKKMRVLLAMTEMPADRSQGRLLGVKISMGDEDIENMDKARVENGWPKFTDAENLELREEIGTIHELHALSAEDFYDVILRAVDENMYHLIVIDSIGNALSAAEQLNDSVKDKEYGGTSAPNTTFVKKLTNLLTMRTPWGEVRNTCVIGVNQVRDNIKDPNKKYKSPGGNALEHAKMVDVYMESGKMLGEEIPVYTPDGTKKRWVSYGKEVTWKIEKGKAGLHEGAFGAYIYDFRTNNVDYYMDTLIAGVHNGVIITEGSWIRIPDPNNSSANIFQVQGRDKFIQALAMDAQAKALTEELSFMDFIRDQCFKKNNINISYEDWE